MSRKQRIAELHKELNRALMPPKLFADGSISSDKDLRDLLSPLCQKIEVAAPKRLIRMRSCEEYSLSALENDQLFLTRADQFNDPYDSLFYFDEEKLKRSIKSHLSEDGVRDVLRSRGAQFPVRGPSQNGDKLIRCMMDKKMFFE